MATNDEMSNEAGSAFLPVILAGKLHLPRRMHAGVTSIP
jgi:hypothetical protein